MSLIASRARLLDGYDVDHVRIYLERVSMISDVINPDQVTNRSSLDKSRSAVRAVTNC